MSRENVEVVRRTLEVFGREGSAGSFAGLLTDDLKVQPAFEVTGGESFVGADGFMLFMGQWTEAFDAWAFEVVEILDADDKVVARLRQTARGKASGTPVELPFGVVFRFRDRLIARMDFYLTESEALEAVGLKE
jgi:ketosteroid isomerase-like protein